MLTSEQRAERYMAQAGRTKGDPFLRLTPRQARRIRHKLSHQQPLAVERRAERSAARAKVRAARNSR